MNRANATSSRCAGAAIRRRPVAPLGMGLAEPVRIKTVDAYTSREVLRIRQGVEPSGEVDVADEYFWAELLKDCAEADVFEAVWTHYRRHARRLWPADILCWVQQEGSRRREAGYEAWQEGHGMRLSAGWGAETLARWDEAYQTELLRGATHAQALAVADWAAEGGG